MKSVIIQVGAVLQDEPIVAALMRLHASDYPLNIWLWPTQAKTVDLLKVMDIPHLPLVANRMWGMTLDDSSASDWARSLSRTQIDSGEIGEYEGLRLYECLRSEVAWVNGDCEKRRMLLAAAATTTRRIRFILMSLQPSLLVLWNSRTGFSRVSQAIADQLHLETAIMERGFFPSTLYLDKGYNEDASIATPAACQEICDRPSAHGREWLELFRNDKQSVSHQADESSPERIRSMLGLPPDARWILHAGQGDDYMRQSRTKPFASNEAILRTLDTAVSSHPNTYVIYKPHPIVEAPSTYNLPNVRLVENVHLHSLIESAALVTVSSSYVGLEAIALGKPVLYCGDSIVNSPKLARHAATEQDVATCVADILNGNWTPDPDSVANYFGYLVDEFLLHADDADTSRLGERLMKYCGDRPVSNGDFLVSEWSEAIALLDEYRLYKDSFTHIMQKPSVRIFMAIKNLLSYCLGKRQEQA